MKFLVNEITWACVIAQFKGQRFVSFYNLITRGEVEEWATHNIGSCQEQH